MRVTFVSLMVSVSVIAACVGDDPGIAGGNGTGDSSVVDGDGNKPDAKASGNSDDAGEPPAAIDVHVLRNPAAPGHPEHGHAVRIEDVVVTGVKTAGDTHGFFVQSRTEPAWGGVYVFVGPSVVDVAPGDVVSATGMFKRYRGLDQIDVVAGEVVRTGKASVPKPLEVSVADIMEGGPKADELQSVLLVVQDVTVSKVNTSLDFTVTGAGGTGGLLVTSYVANDVGPSPFPATLNQTFSSIRGFGLRSGPSDVATFAKLAPASAADVVTP